MDGIVHSIATSQNTPEDTIRFFFALLAGYPLALVYRILLHGRSEVLHHIFFTTTGIGLIYFNFGFKVFHSLVNILVIYALLKFAGGTRFSVAFAFLFNTVYLLIGYIENSLSSKYVISWVIPHCILTLRLTALVFDVFDGKKNEESLSKDQKKTYLKEVPSLISICGQSYFFGSVLAGPLFSMRRYLSFTRGEFTVLMAKDALHQKPESPFISMGPSFRRFMLALLYASIFHVGQFSFPDSYYFTYNYQRLGFLTKCLYILLWGKVTVSKYFGTWLFAEGACILSGISYNGKDINGNILWDGVSNLKIYQLEVSTSFNGMIQGFHLSTNKWVFCYIYKRLRFLGNKMISQAVSLFYLALWHGVFSGYYMNFFLEFIMVNSENQATALVQKVPFLHNIKAPSKLKPMIWVVKKTLLMFSIFYAIVSFVLLSTDAYMPVYASVYFIGHVVFLGYPVVNMILMKLLVKPHRSAVTDNKKKETKLKEQ